MELFINNKSGAPIYDQIYNQILFREAKMVIWEETALL